MKERTLRRCVAAIVVCSALFHASIATALNIVWVSDNGPDGAFTGPQVGTADDAFITNLLWSAGHNVIRYNPPASTTALLPAADVAALNTNDLIIVGRSIASATFLSQPANSWNMSITKPLIMCSPFLTRAANLGWFSSSSAANTGSPTPLGLLSLTNAKTLYLFEGVALNGTNTVQAYDEPLGQNTSVTADAPQGGGVVYARTLNATIGTAIADWPAGAVIRSGTNTLGGYRMFFAAGNREVNGGAVSTAGAETLSPMGEQVFLRAVLLAANNGVPPNIVYDPIIISSQPASMTTNENANVAFNVAISQGTLPHYQWYSNDIAITGATLNGISVAATAAASGSSFYVIITNNAGAVTSTVATLTVVLDTNPPVVLGARATSPRTVVVFFNEPMDPVTATDITKYDIYTDGGLLFTPSTATLSGKAAVVFTLPDDYPRDAVGHLDVLDVKDRAAAGNSVLTNVPVQNYGAAHGNIVWVSDNGPFGFSGPVANTEDDVFTTNLLFYAGYNVIRYNADNNPSNFVAQADIDALNTNDLIIVGRSSGSGPFSGAVGTVQAAQWNTNIFKPLIVMTPYAARATALGWVTNDTLPDDTQTQLIGNTNSPLFSLLFTNIAMIGDTTLDPFDRPLDRNTSMAAARPAGSGVTVAIAAENNATAIATYRAGSAVRGGADVLAGYRMLFCGGTREVSSVPTAGKNNFTAIGELIFQRAVQAAIDQGAQPGRINGASFSGGNFSAEIPTRTAVTYQVQYKTTLQGSWTPLTNIVGDGTLKPFIDPAPVDSARFYRAVVLQ